MSETLKLILSGAWMCAAGFYAGWFWRDVDATDERLKRGSAQPHD